MSDPNPDNVTLGEVYRLLLGIDKAINGNGQPGLIKIVERHDAWLKVFGASLAVVAGAVARSFFS